jgi:hypothetical protein
VSAALRSREHAPDAAAQHRVQAALARTDADHSASLRRIGANVLFLASGSGTCSGIIPSPDP